RSWWLMTYRVEDHDTTNMDPSKLPVSAGFDEEGQPPSKAALRFAPLALEMSRPMAPGVLTARLPQILSAIDATPLNALRITLSTAPLPEIAWAADPTLTGMILRLRRS